MVVTTLICSFPIDRLDAQTFEPGWIASAVTSTQFQPFAPVPLISREARTINLAAAVALADRQNLDSQRAGARRRIAASEAREARLQWIPALSGSMGVLHTNGQVQGSFGDFRDVSFDTIVPFARFTLGLNPAETWFRNSAATHRSEAADAQEHSVRRLVLLRIAELYYKLVRGRASIDVFRMAAEDARALLQITDVLLRRGLGRGDDAARARAEVANAEQRLIEAERRFHEASINLAAALDIDPRVTLVPADDGTDVITLVSPDLDLDEVLRRAVEARPEIAAARRNLDARRADRQSTAARLASPSVEVFYEEGAIGADVGRLAPLTRYGLEATWTISAGGFRAVKTASTRSEEASLALRQAEQEVRADAVAAWNDLRLQGARIEKARQARESAETTLRISQVRFRNGSSLAIEVLLAEQVVEQARLSEISAVVDYNTAQVRLRTEMGPVTPGDLSGTH